MKTFALLLFLVPIFGFASISDKRELIELRTREFQLKVAILEVHSLYQSERTFIAAFDASQKKWEEYCAAMLEARFPGTRKLEDYGSAFELAYVTTKIGLIDARIKEVSLWIGGTEESNVSRGSIKLSKELDEIRKKRKG